MAAPINLFPNSIDLASVQSPVTDQGDIGSCTGEAIAGMLECLQLLELRDNAARAEVFTPGTFCPVSRLFIYYQERVIEGDPGIDAGASVGDGVTAVGKVGFCRETLWPYTAANVLAKPIQAAYDDAVLHKEQGSYRIDLATSAQRQCLVYGYPFIASISVYDSFMWSSTHDSGIIPMPGRDENLLGGHAILITGYTPEGYFAFKNSWGVGWGMSGYGKIPMDYLSDSDLTSDCWTMR